MVSHLGYGTCFIVASTSWQLHLCTNLDFMEIIFGRLWILCIIHPCRLAGGNDTTIEESLGEVQLLSCAIN